MAAGPCWRRGRVVRRYMPMRIQHHRLYVKAYSSMHVSMYCELFRKGNAVNTGVPGPKVPIHRKLGSGGRMGVGIPQTTVSSCTPTATGKSIAKRWMWHHRVPQGAFERLELLEGKLSRTVFMGVSGSQ